MDLEKRDFTKLSVISVRGEDSDEVLYYFKVEKNQFQLLVAKKTPINQTLDKNYFEFPTEAAAIEVCEKNDSEVSGLVKDGQIYLTSFFGLYVDKFNPVDTIRAINQIYVLAICLKESLIPDINISYFNDMMYLNDQMFSRPIARLTRLTGMSDELLMIPSTYKLTNLLTSQDCEIEESQFSLKDSKMFFLINHKQGPMHCSISLRHDEILVYDGKPSNFPENNSIEITEMIDVWLLKQACIYILFQNHLEELTSHGYLKKLTRYMDSEVMTFLAVKS